MPQITSGRVVYSRTIQPAQYEPRRVEIELVFTLDENDQNHINQHIRDVGAMARREALDLVARPDAAGATPAKSRRHQFQARGRDDED